MRTRVNHTTTLLNRTLGFGILVVAVLLAFWTLG
jgi:hypothetical protein